MSNLDKELSRKMKKEANESLFEDMTFDSRMKNRVMQQTRATSASEGWTSWFTAGRRKWVAGAASIVLVAAIAFSLPMLNDADPTPIAEGPPTSDSNPSTPPGDSQPVPDPSGSGGSGIGSDLSELETVQVQTPDEASELYGPELLTPTYTPDGFTLSGIEVTGMRGEAPTRVHMNYASGDQVISIMQNKQPLSFPMDSFESIEVQGVDGYVYEQPTLTELYWEVDGIQYSIMGPVSAEEALKMAESMQ